ncbi:MAG: YfiR family protein [Terracidiphilus sp.]
MLCAFKNPVVKATERARALVPMLALLWVVALALEALQPACAQPATDEYKVKAAFLFHFAQLVDWPSGSFNAEDQSFNLCIFDDEPHRQALQSTLEGSPLGTRLVHVRLLNQMQSAQGCSLFFLSRDESLHQNAILKNLRDQPVLTVGEADNFLLEGGIIRLHLDQGKIRFDINVGAAESSHLKISSRLLLLASSVKLGDGMKSGN